MKRGAQHNPKNKFDKHALERDDEYLEFCRLENEEPESHRTRFTEVHPKTIINEVKSPDVGFGYSINPYQGCEHGCVYCYARPTHQYWGYNAGQDFEKEILVKKNAPELLMKAFSKPSYVPKVLMISGNTDCYQPGESKYGITRELLKVCLEARHPVGIITKNTLLLRDLDILSELNALGLLNVTLSVTTLQEELRRFLEPRTSSVQRKLKAIRILSDYGIRVNVNMAPVIPGLNDHEIFELIKKTAEAGAVSATYILVRLNQEVEPIFEDWVKKTYPDRAEKVLNGIRECRDGALGDTKFSRRMKGSGERAEHLRRVFKLAVARYMPDRKKSVPDFTQFRPLPGGQRSLF